MKKRLAFILSLFLLITLLPLSVAAADDTNVAPLGTPYSSADYNEWAPKSSINNKSLNDSWQAQHISRNPPPGVGAVGEYCGVRFLTDFYMVSEIRVCVGTHGNPVLYGISALIEGEWIELAELSETDATVIDGYSWLIVPLDEAIVTNNVRVTGKDYVGWDLPYVREVEIIGHKTDAPEVIVPEGGVITRNAALAGFAYASSSADGHYPALINDDKRMETWQAEGSELPANVGIRFTQTRTVNRIFLDTGADNGAPYELSFDIEALIDGTWTVITQGTCNADNGYVLDYTLTEKVVTDNVRVVFTAANAAPQMSELQIYSDEKNVFIESRMTPARMEWVATGNVAILGEPYALTTFELYSSTSSINDGVTSGRNAMWVAEGENVPTYCGVQLPFAVDVNKVVIHFEDEGDTPRILKYDVQALVGSEYVTVATGYSHNKTSGYVAILTFDTVTTSDIRIVYTKSGLAFPHLNELCVYMTEDFPNPYDGYTTDKAYGGPEKPADYDEEAAKIEEPLTYSTTTRNTIDKIVSMLSALPTENVLSAAIGSAAILALAGAAIMILNKKNL